MPDIFDTVGGKDLFDTVEKSDGMSETDKAIAQNRATGTLPPGWNRIEKDPSENWAMPPMIPEVLEEPSFKEKVSLGPLGKYLGIGTGEQRAIQRERGGAQGIMPQDLIAKGFEWLTPPPVVKEAIKETARHDPIFNAIMPDHAKGVREGITDVAVDTPWLAGVGAMPPAIGKALMAAFGGEYVWNLPDQKAQFDAYMESGDQRNAYRVLTANAVNGALLGVGGALEARNLMAKKPAPPEYLFGDKDFLAPEGPKIPEPDLVSRNIQAPGTVRPTEIRGDLSIPEPPADLFSVGNVPFERLPRFGGVGAPRIIPKIAEQPIEILPAETPAVRGGELGFRRGAEAPVVEATRQAFDAETQQAVKQAESLGLSEAAKAAREVAGPKTQAPYRKPAEFTDQKAIEQARRTRRADLEAGMELPQPKFEETMPVGQYPPEGMPTGTLSQAQRRKILAGQEKVRSNVRNNPPEPPVKEIAIEASDHPEVAKQAPELLPQIVKDELKLDPEAYKGEQPKPEVMQQVEQAFNPVAEGQRVAKMSPDEFLQESRAKQNMTGWARDVGSKIKDQAALQEFVKLEGEAKAAADSMFSALKEAPPEMQVKILDQLSAMANRKQFFTEAIEQAVGGIKEGKKATVEEMAKLREKGIQPSIIDKLNSLKIKNEGEGRLYSLPHPDAIKAVAKGVWNDALDLAIAAVKAGRAVGDAINTAISHIKRNAQGFDEAKLRQNLDYIIAEETKPKAAPAKQVESVPETPAVQAKPNLERLYKIFEPVKEEKPSVGSRISKAVEATRTGLSSKFRPMNKLAEDIANKYNAPVEDVAAKFEALSGSQGKAKADVERFDRSVADGVKGMERDFNIYMFSKRALDRLEMDLKDIEAEIKKVQDNPIALESELKKQREVKLNRREVGDYTIPQAKADLAALREKLGPEKFAKLEKAGQEFQVQLDEALKLQLESGRMSMKTYDAIKDGNQFYAPFRLQKYLERTEMPEGTGRRIDTQADYTKAMKGIKGDEIKLADMMAAARDSITKSRILAEKNSAMRELSDLAVLDRDGMFIRKLAEKQEPPKGWDEIRVMEKGETTRYAVDKTVADAVRNIGPNGGAILLRLAAIPFKAGVTGMHIPFAVGNALIDQARLALISRLGIRMDRNMVRDMASYPFDVGQAFLSSVKHNVFGKADQIYLDFLDSGAANSTIQNYFTPDGLIFKAVNESPLKYPAKVLNSVPQLISAVEETSKIAGVKRAMRFTGAETGKQVAQMYPEMVTEVRRFAGSPDFSRVGSWTEKYRLNLLQMFMNARIQGTVADFSRMFGGAGGKSEAGRMMVKLGVAVGAPTIAAYLLNEKYRDDYEKRPENERRNYWLIPKEKFITAENGEKMRDYWKIPKRDIIKWVANSIEAMMDFYRDRDPDSFAKFAQTSIEDMVPLNISGNTFQERVESVAAGSNPLVKAPAEMAFNRDFFRHKSIVPQWMENSSPEQQYRAYTPDAFIKLADLMPDVAPEVFRSPLMLEKMVSNLTGNMVTQFLPMKNPPKEREGVENFPLLKKFQAVPFTDSTKFDEELKKYKREAADRQLATSRAADEIIKTAPSLEEAVKQVVEKHGRDEKLARRVVDLWLAKESGITPQEKQILMLPVEERAKWLAYEFKGASKEKKAELIREYSRKRILTKAVAEEMVDLGVQF